MFQAKGKQAEMGKAFNGLRTSKEFSVAGSRPARGRDVGEEGKDYSGPKTKTGNLDFLSACSRNPLRRFKQENDMV